MEARHIQTTVNSVRVECFHLLTLKHRHGVQIQSTGSLDHYTASKDTAYKFSLQVRLTIIQQAKKKIKFYFFLINLNISKDII